MSSFADMIISFCRELDYTGPLPEGISIMNPFSNDPRVMIVVSAFYRKFYSDNRKRHLIIGINPGRFGAGITGIPFTDTARLREKCGLSIPGLKSYETSSVFIYEMIDRYGGPEKFYGDFYISSVSPLGFTSKSPGGREVNYNYYDSRELTEAISELVINSLKKQLGFGIKRDICFCLGTGKNLKFLAQLNKEHHFFERIEPLEHPRFIMQYRTNKKNTYIDKYIEKFSRT
jgi:hypothetical protein